VITVPLEKTTLPAPPSPEVASNKPRQTQVLVRFRSATVEEISTVKRDEEGGGKRTTLSNRDESSSTTSFKSSLIPAASKLDTDVGSFRAAKAAAIPTPALGSSGFRSASLVKKERCLKRRRRADSTRSARGERVNMARAEGKGKETHEETRRRLASA
jgi:hypothetical protein